MLIGVNKLGTQSRVSVYIICVDYVDQYQIYVVCSFTSTYIMISCVTFIIFLFSRHSAISMISGFIQSA